MPEQNYDDGGSFNNISYKQDTFHDESHSYLSEKNSFQKRPNPNPKTNETWRDYGQEVEKLRLQLDHEYKMELLRQKNKALELEEQKLRNQQYELTIKEQQLQQQKQDQLKEALQEAKRKEETKRKLLQQVKKQVLYIQKSSRAKSWDQQALAQWENFYNQQRLHSSLHGKTPWKKFLGVKEAILSPGQVQQLYLQKKETIRARNSYFLQWQKKNNLA